MLDSKGVIRSDRKNLSKEKKAFATNKNLNSLKDSIKNADVFIGLSKPDILSITMLKSMAKDPIVFAMANPDPEINYDLACSVRNDVIMATGRSDHPNQVNNVLGFPFIFRGALDVRASTINEEMKLAAVKALAELAKESVPEQVNIAYGVTSMSFGRNYIIPKPFDPRLISRVPLAVAKAAVKSGVSKKPIKDWNRYKEDLESRLGSNQKIVRLIHDRAKSEPKRLVFAEADQLDVLKAAQIVQEEGIAETILLGNRETIEDLKETINFEKDVEIIDPKDRKESKRRKIYSEIFWQDQKRRGYTKYDAKKLMRERNYFAAMMIKNKDADAMISGYSRNYPSVIKPILEIIPKAKSIKRVAATNLMLTKIGTIFISDTTLNVDPSAQELATIAKMTAKAVEMFGIKPILAMLSFSNFGSSKFPQSNKVSEAVEILHKTSPEIIVDGPIQSDFALNKKLLDKGFLFHR